MLAPAAVFVFTFGGLTLEEAIRFLSGVGAETGVGAGEGVGFAA